MRLRPRTSKPRTRQPLQESTGNQQHKKRRLEEELVRLGTGPLDKKPRAMDGDKQSPPKKRGRPPGKTTAGPSTAFDLTDNPSLKLLPTNQGPSSASSPGRTSSPSRSKKGLLDLGYTKPDTALGRRDLQSCQPPVFQRDIAHARRSGPVPPAVEALYKKLTSVKYACIPPGLKVTCFPSFASAGVLISDLQATYHTETDTPKKSRDAPSDEEFLPSTAKQFPSGRLSRMKQSVDQIQQDAGWNHCAKAHERNWGILVSVILFDYEIFQPGILAVNVETCSIAPGRIRLASSTGEAITTEENSTTVTTESGNLTPIGRMIDWVLTLELNDDEMELISGAFATVEYVWRSMNQSLTDFVRHCPVFVDFELKKELSVRDPEVQLAVWAAAGLLKKRQMQWSTELPMPGIVVDGHLWTCYLFFEQNETL
ncbi:MAG: hypothetical protein Q9210_004089, partial [Variospora velana]